VRIPLASSDPWIALEGMAAQAGLSKAKNSGTTIEELFAAEQAALASQRVVPLFHLPVFYAASAGLRDWAVRTDGSLEWANAWLGAAK
jgi:MarR-like DNA-binding transcriptional regulator SgrR of sgrS sRNA